MQQRYVEEPAIRYDEHSADETPTRIPQNTGWAALATDELKDRHREDRQLLQLGLKDGYLRAHTDEAAHVRPAFLQSRTGAAACRSQKA